MDGVSFLDALSDPAAPEHHTQQYFEMHGNVSIYSDGWVAAHRMDLLPWAYTFGASGTSLPWELYDLRHDYSEAANVAAAHPATLVRLQKLFDEEATKNNVFPIDPRFDGRAHPNPPPPGGRAFYTFYPGATRLYGSLSPGTLNRTHTFTAYVDMPASGGDGVLVAEGSAAAGYTLYIKDRRPSYTYNYFRRDVTTVSAKDPLPAGKSIIELHVAYEGGGVGKGATVTLTVNGKKAGEARLARTVPRAYSFEETFDVGEDSASPVGPYAAPFPFTGTLERLELRSEAPPALTPGELKMQRETAQRISDAVEPLKK
jgi:arylsulfatase